jgi:hypothetical protein
MSRKKHLPSCHGASSQDDIRMTVQNSRAIKGTRPSSKKTQTTIQSSQVNDIRATAKDTIDALAACLRNRTEAACLLCGTFGYGEGINHSPECKRARALLAALDKETL